MMKQRVTTWVATVVAAVGFCVSGQGATTWFVSTGGSDAAAGTSESTALKSLSEAVTRASDLDTIRILAGDHSEMATVAATHGQYKNYSCLAEVTKNVHIIGAGPNRTVLRCRKDGRTYAAGIYLNCADAVVEGVTVVDYNSDNSGDDRYGCGAYVTAGVVTNCSFTACAARNHRPAISLTGADSKGYAIAVTNTVPLSNTKTYLVCVDSGALLADSEIARNKGGELMYAALGVKGGIVRNCTIADNDAESNQKKYAGGVYVESSGVLADSRILRNHLSWRNKSSDATAGGVRVDAGLVTNCLIVANRDEAMGLGGTSSGGLTLNGASARAVDCTLVGNVSFTAGPQFRVVSGTASGILVESDGTGNDFADATGVAGVAAPSACGFRDRTDYELHPLSDWAAYGWHRPAAPTAASLLALPGRSMYRAGSDVVVTAKVANATPAGYTWTVTCGSTVTHPAAGDVLTLTKPAAGDYTVQVAAAGLTSSAELKVMPTKCYLSPTGGAGTYPYDSSDKATSSIDAALEAVYPDPEDPCTVEVAAGTYNETPKTFYLGTTCRNAFVLKPVRIVGADRETAHFDFSTWSTLALGGIQLSHPQAVLANVRITNVLGGKDGWQENAASLDIISGRATNVSVSGSAMLATHGAPIVGVRADGVLEDSFVCDNKVGSKTGYDSWGRNVMGVYVNGGTVRRTEVCRNVPKAGKTDKMIAAGMRVKGATAHVSDCVIEGNVYNGGTLTSKTVAGLYLEGGVVERCIVQCNTNALSTAAATSAGGVYFCGGTLRNCLIAGNYIMSTSSDSAGGLYVDTTSGEASHLTVVRNASSTASALGGVISKGNVLKASLVSGNDGNTQMSVVSGGPQYCCYPEASDGVGTGNVATPVVFVGKSQAIPTDFASVGEFAITRASGGFEIVPVQYATDDLAGAARPLVAEGGAPSAGALEPAVVTEFTATLTTSQPSYAAGDEAVFTLALDGSDPTVKTAWWTVVTGTVTNEYETAVGELRLTLASGSYEVAVKVENNSGDKTSTALPDPVKAYPRVTYVSTDGSGTWPYDTAAKAARSFYEAVDAVYGSADNPGVVHVAPGVYRDIAQKTYGSLTYLCGLDKPVRVVGDAGCEQTVVVLQGDGDSGNGFLVNHTGATLEGLTITGSYGTSGEAEDWKTYGAALSIGAGLVRNCAVTGLQARCSHTLAPVWVSGGRMERCRVAGNRHPAPGAPMYGFGRSAMGVYNLGGTVADCEISGNGRPDGWNTDRQVAGGLYQTAGVTSNCTIRANCSNNNNVHDQVSAGGVTVAGGQLLNCAILANTNSTAIAVTSAAGLYVSSAATVVRNCLVAENVYDSTLTTVSAVQMSDGTMDNVTVCNNEILAEGADCSGLRLSGGTVRNTVVWDNTPATVAEVVRTAGTLSYCCYPEATEGENGNTARDPKLRSARRGYEISPYESCFRTGLLLDWMTDAATDLKGRPRTTLVKGVAKVNIGCQQTALPPGLVITFR